jgi:hypothetical protein
MTTPLCPAARARLRLLRGDALQRGELAGRHAQPRRHALERHARARIIPAHRRRGLRALGGGRVGARPGVSGRAQAAGSFSALWFLGALGVPGGGGRDDVVQRRHARARQRPLQQRL